MAKDEIVLDVTVQGTGEGIKSVKELKQALKEARDAQLAAASAFGEGSKELIEASKRVSALKDKVEDLNDSTQSLKGSGIERASQGFSQLGDGLRNLDLDKVKVGFTALKSAIASTGVLLLVSAVTYLIENFEELSKGSGVIAKVLQFVGTVVNGLKDAFVKLTDQLGLTNSALDKMGEALKGYGDIVSETIAKQNAEFDRHIAIAKASGKNTIELEKAKQEAIIRTNKVLVEQIIQYVKNGGVLNEEQQKLLSQSLENIKNAKTQETVLVLTEQTKQNEAYKKQLEEKERLQKEHLAKLSAEALANEKSLNDSLKALREVQKTELSNTEAVDGEVKLQQINAVRTKDFEDHKAFEQQKEAIAIDAATRTTSSLQSLSDVFFDYKRKNLKKGSAEDIAAAKKQFNINKALGIASATIQGVQGVIAAYSSGAAIPIIGAVMGPVFAVLAGVAAAANIAKISSAKFDEGGGGGSASSLSSGSGAASIPSPPTINTPGANTNTGTLFDSTGKNTTATQQPNTTITVKAQVVETEMTDKQNEMNTIKTQSTF